MYLVLGHERMKTLFTESTVEFWFQAYIELLQRFRLVNQATVVRRITIYSLHTFSTLECIFVSR